ncbi:MAG: hypothetical protein JXA30_00545 [Deltaproteobacteria bacterium]|nr:hypothetical protein [Deltaproteobacteria bacterium]
MVIRSIKKVIVFFYIFCIISVISCSEDPGGTTCTATGTEPCTCQGQNGLVPGVKACNGNQEYCDCSAAAAGTGEALPTGGGLSPDSAVIIDSGKADGAVAGKAGSIAGGTGGVGGSTPSGGSGGEASGGTPGVDTGVAGSAVPDSGVDTGTPDFTKLKDPGTGPWQEGTPEECKMDPTKFRDTGLSTYAVFRYGKLCHMKGSDTAGQMFSATKTLGGVMAGRAAYVARDVPRAGPGTGPILYDDLGTDWIAVPSYPRRDALITHIMAMVASASPSLDDAALTYRYDTIGAEAINNMIAATEKCIAQVPGVPTNAVAFVQQEIFDKLGMTNSSWPGGMIATGWTANMSDMGRLGTLMLHDGWYNGERLLSQEWVYRMSHPAFESANTSYGHLTWLNHRGNAAGIGGDISSGSNSADGDPCAPAAFWSKYPHPPSEATDCMATVPGASCVQQFDVGVYSAQGLGGQFVVMHPGLDMVIVARNFSGGGGPMGMWEAVRPGVVAMDPKYNGDEAAFCNDYGAGNYAPDLFVPRFKP